MKRNTVDEDYTYCSGITCPVRKDCKRYLPNPPDVRLWWVDPAYKTKYAKCPNFVSSKRE